MSRSIGKCMHSFWIYPSTFTWNAIMLWLTWFEIIRMFVAFAFIFLHITYTYVYISSNLYGKYIYTHYSVFVVHLTSAFSFTVVYSSFPLLNQIQSNGIESNRIKSRRINARLHKSMDKNIFCVRFFNRNLQCALSIHFVSSIVRLW